MHSIVKTLIAGAIICVFTTMIACSSENETINSSKEVSDIEADSVAYDLYDPENLLDYDVETTVSTRSTAQLEIIVRDFQSSHPDFENFSNDFVENGRYIAAQAAKYNFSGYDTDWASREKYHNTCASDRNPSAGIAVGTDGKPMSPVASLPDYLSQDISQSSEILEYGDCEEKSENGKPLRGFNKMDLSWQASLYHCRQSNRANKVYFTPNMVKRHLDVSDTSDPETGYTDWMRVKIQKNQEACDNSHFDEWFNDVPGINKRSDIAIDAPQIHPKYYAIKNSFNDGGYFPLDNINDQGNYIGIRQKKYEAERIEEWGPQSFSIFCPPYGYQYAPQQVDGYNNNTYVLCAAWLRNGGPKDDNAALLVADSYADKINENIDYAQTLAEENDMDGKEKIDTLVEEYLATANRLPGMHLRNYHHTTMSHFEFKYSYASITPNHESFYFASSDDMWVFVDGVLVIDLGGTHPFAPGSVNIRTLAENNHGCHAGEPLANGRNCDRASETSGWANDSWHHVHVFYANRQTEESSLFEQMILAELSPKYKGPHPIILGAQNKENSTLMYLNTILSEESLRQMELYGKESSLPTMIAKRCINEDEQTKVCLEYKMLGYYVTSMNLVSSSESDSVMYEVQGILSDGSKLEPGDKISLNHPVSEKTRTDFNEFTNAMNYAGFTIESAVGTIVAYFPKEWAEVK